MTDHVDLRRGAYHDSVTLLRVSQAASAVAGVSAATVAMATELNLELAAGLGFSIPDGVGPNDLLIAVRGDDDAAVAAGIAAVEAALAAGSRPAAEGGFGGAPAPRSVRAAAAAAPDAAVVLISVPGPAVLGEAMDAIEAGRHVMIFSDNVPVEHEIALKDAAAAAGVLVMGPDCGTAVIGGVGLGFANVLSADAAPGVPRVGVIAASGTGAQQLTALLDQAGVPVSQVIGLGGRDLSAQIGGRSALAALALLDADPATDHIVIVSKPPDPAVEQAVLAAAAAAATPVTSVLLGAGRPDLSAAAATVLGAVGVPVPTWPSWGIQESDPAAGAGALRGIYSGGTLADEAMIVASDVLGDIRSNIPLRPELALPTGRPGIPSLSGLGHAVVDLGDDEFTRGRPHPMIDPSVKLEVIASQGADPDVRVILLDVVLGHCAEADPAARLAPVVAAALAAREDLSVLIALCGTDGDPQDRERQAYALVDAGAQVFLSNAEAARAAAAIAAGVAA